MAGESIPSIDKQRPDLAQKRPRSSPFPDGDHTISPFQNKKQNPQKQCGKSLSTTSISVPSLKVLSSLI